MIAIARGKHVIGAEVELVRQEYARVNHLRNVRSLLTLEVEGDQGELVIELEQVLRAEGL